MDSVAKRAKTDDKKKEDSSVKIVDDGRNAKGFDKFVRKVLPNPELLRKRISQAGLDASLNQYFLVCLAVLLAVTFLIAKLIGLPLLPSAMFGVGAGLGIPHIVLGILVSRRSAKFLANFPESIDLMVRGLKSGLPVSETIKTVGAEMEDPIGIEFRRIISDLQVGRQIEEALWRCADRIGVPEFRFFVVCISVQRETGGNLGETLENLSDILRKRRAAKLKVKSLSAEARFSALLIGSLPFIMLGILYLVNPDYISTLWTDIRGIILLSVGGGWMSIGFLVMAKMMRFEV
jgi:tight adherence protein B